MTMQIKFGYPRRGLTGQFATFRLGLRAAQRFPVGTQVELVDSRSLKVLKRATVQAVDTGTLTDMAAKHAALAHNWREHPEADRPGLLSASMQKRHYPGRCTPESKVSVLILKEDET